jgi:hypothetical protein
MTEKTFAGRATRIIDIFAGRESNEFVDVGLDVLQSEELSDAVYRTYIALLTGGWKASAGDSLSVDDVGHAYMNGFYLPCCVRPVLSGQIDLANDKLPEHAAVVLFNDRRNRNDQPLFISVRQVKKFNRNIQCPPFAAAKYVGMWMWDGSEIDRTDRRIWPEPTMSAVTAHFAVMPSGTVVPCADSSRIHRADYFAAFLQTCAAAINTHEDRHHLWQVSTSEPLIGASIKTPLVLGCSPEHIKSLFYARSLPVTETGRRRPILHWVQAHNRRLQAGIEIDVNKHLRGIEKFEMDGFNFEITNPRKSMMRAA